MNEPVEHNSATTPGERLKQAREQAGLSIERVAKDLYLDAQVIHSIEINRFKDLGAPVYAKGYLRKYARLVGLTEEDVLQRYAALSDAPGVADPIPAAMGSVPESRRPLPRWILWVVIGLIVLAGIATLLNLHNSSEATDQGQLISRPLSAPGATSTSQTGTNAETTNDATTVGPANSAATLSLRFLFTADSWVEVYDANNQQVLYDMGSANTTRDISAVPPLRVVLGSAASVNLQVNSQDVVVPPAHVEAGVGRFVVNAAGLIE